MVQSAIQSNTNWHCSIYLELFLDLHLCFIQNFTLSNKQIRYFIMKRSKCLKKKNVGRLLTTITKVQVFLLKYHECAPEKPHVLQNPTLKISGLMRGKKGLKQNNQKLGNPVMVVLTNTVLCQVILQHSYKIVFLINKYCIGYKHIPLKEEWVARES